jgi:hypothetical protein
MAIVCEKCEREVQDDAKFCSACGYPTARGISFTPEEHRAMTLAFMEHQRKQHGLLEPKPFTPEMAGIRSITPHLALNASGKNALPVSGVDAQYASQATYTSADVVAFSLAHPSRVIRNVGAPLTAADITIQFMTDAQADKVLDIAIGESPDEIICVVQMKGFWKGIMPGGRRNAPDPSLSLAYAYRVLDGKTGNLLVEGARTVAFLPATIS